MKSTFPVIIRAPDKTELEWLPKIEALADAVFLDDRFSGHASVCSVEELDTARLRKLLFIAEVNGDIVGFAMARRLGDYAHLQQLSVIPDYGQQGIGTLLLQKVIEEVSLQECSGITLTTFSDVHWNAPFYRKWGFVAVNDYTDYPDLQSIYESEKLMGLKNRVGMICKIRVT